jgi:hypothetical protein
MRRLLFLGTAIILAACGGSQQAAVTTATTPQNTDSVAVASSVLQFYQGFQSSDTAAMRRTMASNMRLQFNQDRNGQSVTRDVPVDIFFSSIAGAKQRNEAVTVQHGSPVVRLTGNVATVTVPYLHSRNGRPWQCGVDTWQVIRVPSGWRITSLLETQKQSGCTVPSP